MKSQKALIVHPKIIQFLSYCKLARPVLAKSFCVLCKQILYVIYKSADECVQSYCPTVYLSCPNQTAKSFFIQYSTRRFYLFGDHKNAENFPNLSPSSYVFCFFIKSIWMLNMELVIPTNEDETYFLNLAQWKTTYILTWLSK